MNILREITLRARQFNWLTAFALLCVAVSTGFIIYMQVRLTNILAAPDWCARAINAEKLAGGRTQSAIQNCADLLLKQVGSLALNSHIFAGIIALCLLVLIVVVVAKAKLDLEVAKDSARVNVGSDPAARAAQKVASAAEAEADEIATDGP